jgi:hypothetical protein
MREWRRDPDEEAGEVYPTGIKPGFATLSGRLPVQRRERAIRPAPPAEEFGFVQAYGGELREGGAALFPDEVPTRWLMSSGAELQRRGGAVPDGEEARRHAAEGTSGPAEPLPHLERIQPLFGRHDVSSVRAHTDENAAAGARAMGAEAFAVGDRVAFDGAPSLHTAAHEAARVVQQRGGISLRGGVGQAGDSYEQHADAVADLVVRGESAEGLLDDMAGPLASAPATVRAEGSIQAKIRSEGPHEQEADRIAEGVASGSPVRLAGAGAVSPSAAPTSSWPVAEDRVGDVAASLSGGEPLAAAVRSDHEQTLGVDLGARRLL